jgi:hypothetical protein
MPAGTTLTQQIQYGQTLLNWIPTSADVGVYDISVQVTDSGLGNHWQDTNGNHKTDAGELRSLSEAGIASLIVNHTIAPEVQ